MEAKLNVRKFEELVDRRGRVIKWEEASICSCWNLDSGQPAYECNACNGGGYVYEDPINAVALIMNIAFNKQFNDMAGIFEVGDAVASIPKHVPTMDSLGKYIAGKSTVNPMYEIGMYDKVTILDDEHKTSEILVRGEQSHTKAPDTLLNSDITKIKAIRTFNMSTGESTAYEEDTDFTLNGNEIVWVGASPAEGTQYSVLYMHRPTFTVLTALPKPRHQDGQDFPRYAVLRYRAGGFDRP